MNKTDIKRFRDLLWSGGIGFLLLTMSGCKTTGVSTVEPGLNEAQVAEGERLGDEVAVWNTDEMIDETRSSPPEMLDEKQVSARLRPGLSVAVSVYVAGSQEVEETTKRIPDAGVITMPLIGGVSVEGLTLAEFSEVLKEKYGEFFVDPKIIAHFVLEERADGEFTASPWGFVTVLGRVVKQGKVAIPPTQDLTVSTAIQRAGGFSTSAKDSSIVVTRKKPDGVADKLVVNLKAMGRNGAVDEDIVLMAGDVVFVPEEIF